MRISDWSSDVCSSDLAMPHRIDRREHLARIHPVFVIADRQRPLALALDLVEGGMRRQHGHIFVQRHDDDLFARHVDQFARRLVRSEEHTSELQSLMRISYAVFCLKKKKNKHT